ncbi:MAG: response regulator [Limisphaerales bacterium]
MNVSPLSAYSEPRGDQVPAPPQVFSPGPQTIHQAGANQVPVPSKRSLRILCIDDDEQILEMMKNCLTHFNHRVRVASGGKYGIELFCTAILKSEPYDVVITDLSMPDVNGYEVARAIKDECPKTPVIMMTGADATTKDANLSKAVDAVATKPPRIHELNDLLLRVAV